MTSQQGADARAVTRAVGTGAEVLARVTSRVRALREVDHPGILIPHGVGVTAEDQVVVTAPWVEGVDLAELESRRSPLTAGECVWLGVRVSAALEALHARGLAHGDVSPANIVVAGDSVVMVDTVGGCLDDERGTVGFRSPERTSGATTAGDAFSLGALLRWCVAEQDRIPIEAWTAPLMVRDPESRPPVQVAARALASCAPERPLDVPASSAVVSAVRARAAERTERIASGRPWRVRRAALKVGAGLAVVAAGAAGVIGLPRVVDAAVVTEDAALTADAVVTEDSEVAGPLVARATAGLATEPTVATSASAARNAPQASPDEAAAQLTNQRIEALSAGDGEALLATVEDGPLEPETAALARELDAGLKRYEGLAVDVREVRVTTEGPDSSTATVDYSVTAHRVVTPEGETAVPAYDQSVELELRWDGRWTVVRAQPLT